VNIKLRLEEHVFMKASEKGSIGLMFAIFNNYGFAG
jgi:hypothetical protein